MRFTEGVMMVRSFISSMKMAVRQRFISHAVQSADSPKRRQQK